eukprot:6182058-Pleurochrysis_carterae.AAC.3
MAWQLKWSHAADGISSVAPRTRHTRRKDSWQRTKRIGFHLDESVLSRDEFQAQRRGELLAQYAYASSSKRRIALLV